MSKKYNKYKGYKAELIQLLKMKKELAETESYLSRRIHYITTKIVEKELEK